MFDPAIVHLLFDNSNAFASSCAPNLCINCTKLGEYCAPADALRSRVTESRRESDVQN
jgi:hypothetical protein